MSNILRQNLNNKVVLLGREKVSGTSTDELTRLFRCEAGPGISPDGPGVSIQGRFLSNNVHGSLLVTIDASEDIERLASPREIEVAQS